MEGVLLVRSSISWNARYFMIKENRLYYYAEKGDSKEKGFFQITPETEIFDFYKRPYAFRIMTSSKNSMIVCALNAIDETRWRDVLKKTIKNSNIDKTDSNSLKKNWQIVSAAGQDFKMSRKYEMIKAIGHGAYGVVISALDKSNNTKVAIKKIPDTFEDLVDAKRIVREIRLLRSFNHDNVVKVVDLFTSQSYDDFDEVYLVTDLMETDMHRVIYSKQPLTLEHIQYFLYQMMCGLNYIHSMGVIHRDLKPSNILVNANCDLKLCDFGLSRGVNGPEEEEELTEYVVTRWYRAPEIMLSCPTYNTQIDIWSMGCIFGEMLGRKPMFPGSDYIHQLKLILKVIGTPLDSEIGFISNSKAKRFIKKLPKYESIDLLTTYPKANENAKDLLNKMLILDPSKRLNCLDILSHDFHKDIRDVKICEKIESKPINWGNIETCELTKRNLQEILIEDFNALEEIGPVERKLN
mmetsp:Transcript_12433/g.16028  ORF Transcript_12433/g.16028 Transcript_12433/m.16028 type:complete len:466 (-) Transcript_12433:479-1876(-)